MELQVWSSEKQCKDHYIGSIQVDLSPLSFGLAQLSGWYHILDFAGEVQGQLKVGDISCANSRVIYMVAGECGPHPEEEFPISTPLSLLPFTGRFRGHLITLINVHPFDPSI